APAEPTGAEMDHCVVDVRSAPMKAAQMGHAEMVQLLITAKADVNQIVSNNEQTALSMACSGDHAQAVKILLNTGPTLTTAGKTILSRSPKKLKVGSSPQCTVHSALTSAPTLNITSIFISL